MDGDLPEEVTVLVSKTIVLECEANGNPAPTITWQKDGQLLEEDDHHIFLSSGRMLQVGIEFIFFYFFGIVSKNNRKSIQIDESFHVVLRCF